MTIGTKKYQLDGLKAAVSDVKTVCRGLQVSFDFTGDVETTAYGTIPTVEYDVRSKETKERGRSTHPIVVVLLPRRLAQAIRSVLGNSTNSHVNELIDRVQATPVSLERWING
jgi:hypothetical protein